MVRWLVGSILNGRPIKLFLIPASAPVYCLVSLNSVLFKPHLFRSDLEHRYFYLKFVYHIVLPH